MSVKPCQSQVVTGSGGVDAIETADIGGAGLVRRLHMGAGLLDAHPLDCGSLSQPPVGRPVQAHMKAPVEAKYDGRGPAQDHPSTRRRQGKHLFFGRLADLVVVMAVRRRRQGRPGRHGMAKRTEQAVHRGSTRLFGRQPFALPGRRRRVGGAGNAVNERHAQPLGERRGHDAPAGAISRRNSYQPSRQWPPGVAAGIVFGHRSCPRPLTPAPRRLR
jgi:hypothetical protein